MYTIKGVSPKVLWAHLTFDILIIEFDVNIDIANECADNFEPREALGNSKLIETSCLIYKCH